MSRVERARPLFDLIIAHEASPSAQRAQGVASPYDVVWGGIRAKDKPQSPISTLPVRRVLWWQDKIDPIYMSEAAGAFQIMEDTLRTLRYDQDALFDEATQKDLALQLLDRRGWARCESGAMTPEAFGDELAKEWASLPVITGKKRGRSYYAGDGLNKAGATPDEVLRAIHAALENDTPPQPAPVPAHEPITLTDDEVRQLETLMVWVQKAPPIGDDATTDIAALVAWRQAMPAKGA